MSDRISWVRQEHGMGCGLAVVAMLAGESYSAVRQRVEAYSHTAHDGDWEAHGITHITLDRALAEFGFYMQITYIGWHQRRVDDVTDPAAPVKWEMLPGAKWPPEPWADAHYAQVVQPSGNDHFVVMTADGTVLDPLREGTFKLTDWSAVNHVAGLVRP